MPVQTIVASLVLLHLREEIRTLRNELDALQMHADKINPDLLTDNPMITRWVEPQNAVFWCDIQNKMRDIEFELTQSSDAYNNLLTLVRMDNSPEYQPTLKLKRYFIQTRNGRIFE